MAKRVNELRETALALRKNRNELALKEEAAIKEYQERMSKFNDSIESMKEKREFQRHYHGVMKENARNTVLGDILKGIYIGALEAETLTDDALILAENMVDQWIIENGGASAIFAKNRGKTYLIDHIISVVEAEADKEVEEIEDDVEDIQDDVEEDKKDEEEAKDDEDKAEAEDDKEEAEADETEAEEDEAEAEDDSEEAKEDEEVGDDEGFKDAESDEENAEDDAEDKADDADEATDDADEAEAAEDEAPEEEEGAEEEDPLADPSTIDDDEEEEEEDPDDVEIEVDDETGEEKVDLDKVDDVPQDDSDTLADKEEEEQNDKEFLDDLDQEEDVKKAVELIRVRVADAEENFIKQNAEDKKKMDDILGKISDNVKTVEAITKDDEEKTGEDEIKESVAMSRIREGRRAMNEITNHRPLSVFEKFTRNITEGIVKDASVKAGFINESGNIEMNYVVETAKVMYAWLETINTLQLENVNADYIQNILDNM